jgi:hypothetical protein
LVLVCIAAVAAGCGSGRGSMPIRERFEAVQAPHRVAGTTARYGQIVQNNCTISATYEVREATGTAFLIQSQLVHLRLRVPKRGTTYQVECLGPLVAELPARASKISAMAQDLSGGGHRTVDVHTPGSIRLPPGRLVRAAPRKQLIMVELPRRPGTKYDNYRMELRFRLPKAQLVRERVVYTASISCGGSSYLQPMVPLANDLGFVNAFTVPPHGRPFDFILPHIATGISSHGETTRALACAG